MWMYVLGLDEHKPLDKQIKTVEFNQIIEKNTILQ